MKSARRIFHFGVFEFDPQEAQLRKNGLRLRLQPQPSKILQALLERPGEMISREDLRRRLWADDTFVDYEQGLNAAVTRLRQTLGDSAEAPRYIETEARLGYRLVIPVSINGAEAASHEDLPRPQHARTVYKVPAIAISALLVVALGIIYFAYVLHSPRAIEPPPTHLEQITRDLGLTTDPTVSVDGKLLAYASDRDGSGRLNIWVQQLTPGGKNFQLTHFEHDACQPNFSPDGLLIVFEAEGDLYSVPAMGGGCVRIATGGRDPRFSPNGRWIAYWSYLDSAFATLPYGQVFVVESIGGAPRPVGSRPSGFPIWAPNSESLLVTKLFPAEEADWWVVPLDEGPAERTGAIAKLKSHGFSADLASIPRPAAWVNDFVTFCGRQGDAENIWRIAVPEESGLAGDRIERITSGTGREHAAYATVGGDVYYSSQNEQIGNWWLPIQGSETAIPKKLTQTAAREVTLSATPDGKFLFYTLLAGARQEIQRKDVKTGRAEAFAPSVSSSQWHPVVSRDGTRLAYTDRSDAGEGIYVMPGSGDGPAEKIWGAGSWAWSWSKDDKRLLFNRGHAMPEIWSIVFPAKQIAPFLRADGAEVYQAQYSPDDRWLAFAARSAGALKLFIVPLVNGVAAQNSQWITAVDEKATSDKPRWSADGNSLYFVSDRDGYRCLWSQRLNPLKRPVGSPTAVHHFHNARLAFSNVPVGLGELEVTRGGIFADLGDIRGNIWRVSHSSSAR